MTYSLHSKLTTDAVNMTDNGIIILSIGILLWCWAFCIILKLIVQKVGFELLINYFSTVYKNFTVSVYIVNTNKF